MNRLGSIIALFLVIASSRIFGQIEMAIIDTSRLVGNVSQGTTISGVFDLNDVPIAYDIVQDELIIRNLSSATVYKIVYDDVINSNVTKYVITKSQSSGIVETYFNFPIPSWSFGEVQPDGTTFAEVERALRDLIRGAKHTIDYCAYNTNVTSIVNELIDAKARGVEVRVIVERENNNTGFSGSMPFPIVQDFNSGLMHNKFIVVDAEEVSSSFVVNGSMNFTSGQMTTDPNHLFIIQDQSLAKAYTMEFNEMWGGEGPLFNSSKSKFGPFKEDNTPHEFVIGNIRCDLYFSPSDNTAKYIQQALSSADFDVDFGLLIFTYREFRDVLINKLDNGIKVRGIVEDPDNSIDIIRELRNRGADVQLDNRNWIYHHKMAIVDGERMTSNPTLISGSHNWTFSAQNFNDENTMIYYDAGLAQLFKRAFSHHWNQLSTHVEDDKLVLQQEAFFIEDWSILADLLQRWNIQHASEVSLYSVDGKLLMSSDGENINIENLSFKNNGLYLLLIRHASDGPVQLYKVMKH